MSIPGCVTENPTVHWSAESVEALAEGDEPCMGFHRQAIGGVIVPASARMAWTN